LRSINSNRGRRRRRSRSRSSVLDLLFSLQVSSNVAIIVIVITDIIETVLCEPPFPMLIKNILRSRRADMVLVIAFNERSAVEHRDASSIREDAKMAGNTSRLFNMQSCGTHNPTESIGPDP
jgi:hypothetical protein